MSTHTSPNPRFTIITPTWNSASTLARTISSVLKQNSSDIEYLIVDNLSTDSTAEVVRSFADPRIRFISERDWGLYDAMNKGIAQAKGDLVAILNSDDVYSDSTVLSAVDATFRSYNSSVVYGNLVFVDQRDRVRRYWGSGPYDVSNWFKGWHPPHPAVFISKSIYDAYGRYDHTFKLAADYKLLLALGAKAQVKFSYLEKTVVRMQLGGRSTSGLETIIAGNKEVAKAWGDLAMPMPRLLIVRKLFYKFRGKLTGLLLSRWLEKSE